MSAHVVSWTQMCSTAAFSTAVSEPIVVVIPPTITGSSNGVRVRRASLRPQIRSRPQRLDQARQSMLQVPFGAEVQVGPRRVDAESSLAPPLASARFDLDAAAGAPPS